MLPFSDGKHNVYGPDTLEVMCAAYDTAVQLLPHCKITKERAGDWRSSSFVTWIGESLKETSLI